LGEIWGSEVHWTADFCITEIDDNIKSSRCNIFADDASWLIVFRKILGQVGEIF